MDKEQRFLEAQKLYQKQITDLETKLAESEQKREELDFAFEMETTSNKEETEKLFKTIGKLKQQLAEKEKEIEELKKGVYKVTLGTTSTNQIDFTENFYVIQNQTAIDELEKVKDKITYYLLKFDYFTPKQSRQIDKMIEAINQQIKSLKGEK